MRRLALAAALAALPVSTSAKDVKVDFSAVVHMIGAHGIASGCPISPNLVLTAGHVADLAPMDPRVPLFPSRFSTDRQEGWLKPLVSSRFTDLAVMVPYYEPLTNFYHIAEERPKKGEHLHWIGYNWSKKKQAMQPVEFEGEYLDTIAGHVITDKEPEEGSSGGCVLNERNEVVALVSWGKSYGMTDGVSIGPALFPPWSRLLYEQIAEATAAQKEQ